MAHEVKLFLAEEAMIALEDHFADDDDDDALRKFIFAQVKILAKAAKLIKMNKSFGGVVEDDWKNNKNKNDTFYLKDINLNDHSIDSDPSWLPKNIDKNDVKIYILKVGERTWEALQLFVKVSVARNFLFIKSLTKADPNYEDKKGEKAKCFEQVIHDNIVLAVMGKIGDNIDDQLDEEDAEVNKPKKKKPEPEPKEVKKKKK